LAIPVAEQRKLFVKSGNRCAFSECRRLLTADATPSDDLVVLGEAAHIVGESARGPRGNSILSLSERNRYENLLLLCNLHHQLVDAQDQTYTVDRLLAVKEAHELWVERTLGTAVDGRPKTETSLSVTGTVYSTLLPVVQMPRFVYGVPCPSTEERELSGRLGRLRHGEMAPFILRGGMLLVFQNLEPANNPFRAFVNGSRGERFSLDEWWDDPDKSRWLADLLNRSLNKLTGRRDLLLDREHHRYYFAPTEAGRERKVRYKPLNQAQSERKVVWQPISKKTGKSHGYWYHRAVSMRFLRLAKGKWALSLRPELRLTIDGVTLARARRLSGRVTHKRSRLFNYDLLGEVQFWRDYLSESRPRIILAFGDSQQCVVVSTALMRGSITWPGIPDEHGKPFKNVEYLDDLFSWGEFQQIDADAEEEEGTEDAEDSEDV
jgi:hypothetical protein